MKYLPIARDPYSEFHAFNTSLGSHVFMTNGSRVYDLQSNSKNILKASGMAFEKTELLNLLESLSRKSVHKYIDGQPLSPPPLYSLSLNVAQACNMSCGYCYADEGLFGGGRARIMDLEIALASVDRLIAESSPDIDLVIGFMGGEPLLNRRAVHETTKYASCMANKFNRRIRFSITTNGTLIKQEDAELFAKYPFTVTLSIDGTRDVNDHVRKMNDGSSAYDRLISSLNLINCCGRPQHLSARVTVTPKTGELLPILDHIIGLGFDEVGFAAVLVSPVPSLAFSPDDFPLFLKRMVACGEKAINEIKLSRNYPFGNLETALHEIHRGTHRPYPCGAGAAYLSANAEGKLFACHRLIDDPKYMMGNVHDGSNMEARSAHLSRNHVDTIEPCRSCWARYLCGGGCYHEVSRRGRVGCDYIRGWLEFCLQAYVELSAIRPDYFTRANMTNITNISNSTTIME